MAQRSISGARPRVLIDALAARYGGTAYGVAQLAGRLGERADVGAVTVVTRAGSIVERALRGEAAVKCITLPARTRGELAARLVWEALALERLVLRERSDVLVTSSGMLPRATRARVVCLLFNPVMYEAPGPANALRRWAARRTAQRAAHVLAPSSHMAELARAPLGRDVEVVALGVDHEVFSPALHGGGEELLFVADMYAHKRHDLVLDTWLALDRPRPLLRLIGNPAVDRANHERVATRVRSLRGAGPIALEHGLGLMELVERYRRARVFLMPSDRESFCMPLLEALACGVPAVARGLASLRETGGEGAVYVEGEDPARWCEPVRELFRDDVAHTRASAAATASAAGFSWQRMAAEVAARL